MPDAARCSVCNKGFANQKQLASHRWSQHKIKSNIRELIGDISKCPVCENEFFSRVRLTKHLLETRVRAKHRSVSCRQAFLDRNPVPVPRETLEKLEARDFDLRNNARKAGHTKVLVVKPCVRNSEHILNKKNAALVVNGGLKPNRSPPYPHLRILTPTR